jgi:hypothetical protein
VSKWKRRPFDALGEVFSKGAELGRRGYDGEVSRSHAKIHELFRLLVRPIWASNRLVPASWYQSRWWPPPAGRRRCKSKVTGALATVRLCEHRISASSADWPPRYGDSYRPSNETKESQAACTNDRPCLTGRVKLSVRSTAPDLRTARRQRPITQNGHYHL